jgi:hypothetical protein
MLFLTYPFLIKVFIKIKALLSAELFVFWKGEMIGGRAVKQASWGGKTTDYWGRIIIGGIVQGSSHAGIGQIHGRGDRNA